METIGTHASFMRVGFLIWGDLLGSKGDLREIWSLGGSWRNWGRSCGDLESSGRIWEDLGEIRLSPVGRITNLVRVGHSPYYLQK